MCYKIPNSNILCSHAGVSKTWLENMEFENEYSDVENFINNLFIYKPLSFKFAGMDNYGDSAQSSPIWIRENSLLKDGIEGWIQIVGHTVGNNLKQKGNVWMIDTLGTSKEYLVIENNEFLVKKL